MTKKAKKKEASMPGSGYQSATLREVNGGIKTLKGPKSVNSILRMEHLQKLATWAGGEASIPSLGALFGHHLAASAETMGITLDSSIFPCLRCETILQPGHNCTVRIEKNKAKRRCRKTSSVPSQNSVVYTCHFCSHRNLKRGTPKGYIKDIMASRPKPVSASKSISSAVKQGVTEQDIIYLETKPISESKSEYPKHDRATRGTPIQGSPATPFGKVASDGSKNRKKSGLRSKRTDGADNSAATTETGNVKTGSSKRRRKGWSSLKEIAETSERDNARSVGNLSIPFFL